MKDPGIKELRKNEKGVRVFIRALNYNKG